MTPAGYPYLPTANESASVETMPTSTTSAPASRMPSMSAAASSGLETRMSRPTTTVSGWIVATRARPISRARAGVSSSGTIPRTS